MSYDDLLIQLRTGGLTDPEAFLHQLYHSLRSAYRFNQGRFDAEAGDDQGWFGFSVFKNGWHEIEKALVHFGNGVHTDRPKNSLTIFAAGRQIKVYRGGPDEKYDIEEFDPQSGSWTKVGLARANAFQLQLFSTADPDNDHSADLTTLFLVHSGNPDIGLGGVWIGAPKLPTADDPSSWAFVVVLPDLCASQGCGGTGGVSVEPPPIKPVGPSHADIEAPVLAVTLKSDLPPASNER